MNNRKQQSNLFLILLGITVTLTLLFIIYLPIFLLIYLTFLAIKKSRLTSKGQSINDYWLSTEEKLLFIDNDKLARHANFKIQRAHTLASEHNILKNRDGSYNRRSNIGKEISELLNEFEPISQTAVQTLSKLSIQPKEYWASFNRVCIKINACQTALVSWCILYISLSIYYDKTIIDTFLQYMQFNIQDKQIFIIAGLVAFIDFWLHYFLCRNDISQKNSPEPPIVTRDNYDKY